MTTPSNTNDKRRRWRRWAMAAAVALAVAWAVYHDSRRPPEVEVATVGRGVIRAFVEERARTTLPHIYHVTMPLPGRILPMEVREGDRVEEGQVVARLEDYDWIDAASSAEEMLVAMRSAVEAAEAEIKASDARKEYTAWVQQAVEDAIATQALSQRENQEAEWQFLDAVVKREESEANYHAMNAFYSMAKLLPPMVERNLVRTRIKSPVSGVVLHRHVSNEKTMMAGEAIIDLGDLDELQVTADVLTEEAVRVQPGDAVEIFGEAIGLGPVSGSVRRVKPEAFTKLSSLGVEQQRAAVDIDFGPGVLAELAEGGRTLGLNYRVRVRIITDEHADALAIPRRALFRGARGGWEVFRVAGGNRAERTPVEVGLLNDFDAEITGGLDDGDQVVVAPEPDLTDGSRVAPVAE